MESIIPIFDGHNDTLAALDGTEGDRVRLFFEGRGQGHIDFPRAVQGGLAGGLFAIMASAPPGSEENTPDWGMTRTEVGYAQKLRSAIPQAFSAGFNDRVVELLREIEAASGGKLKVVTDADTLEQCIAGGVFAVVLHFEGAEPISEDLSNLEVYYRQGLRSMGIVWSRVNAFASGVPFAFPQHPDTGPGLTPAGRELVRACNELGILVDLSHLNAKGFWEVQKLSTAPLVATHSCAHAICPVSRNLTDDQLAAIGESGGVVGINFECSFLREDGRVDTDTPLEQIVRHVDFVAEKIGVEHVAFGSDFDGARMPVELGDASGLPKLVLALLDRGYGRDDVEKIAWKNWLRVLRATWK